MKKIIIKILKFTLFLSVGIFLFWLIYRGQDIDRIKQILKNKVNYFWVFISLVIGLFSHVSRTVRWQIMIEPVSHKPRFSNTFFAIMIGYLMNLALPRMGEISRCGVLSRYEKISFPKLLGTVVAERAIDVISLLILLLIVIFSQFNKLNLFLQEHPEIQTKISHVFASPFLWATVLILIVIILLFRRKIKSTGMFQKVVNILYRFKEGLISIKTIKQKGWFIFHSIAIWLAYYLMLYVIFFSFDFTEHLSPIAGLTTFVLASFGMVAPVQGGIGAWHFMAKEALALYGVANENGIIFAFVAHTSMTLMIIVVGLLSLLILPFINNKTKITPQH